MFLTILRYHDIIWWYLRIILIKLKSSLFRDTYLRKTLVILSFLVTIWKSLFLFRGLFLNFLRSFLIEIKYVLR